MSQANVASGRRGCPLITTGHQPTPPIPFNARPLIPSTPPRLPDATSARDTLLTPPHKKNKDSKSKNLANITN